LLNGMRGPWQPGLNHARCNSARQHQPAEIPASGCGCGWWAYWQIQHHDLSLSGVQIPVVGVIEGRGQVLIGERGFRAQQATVVALHLPFRIVPDLPADCEPARDAVLLNFREQPEYGRHNPWWNHPLFTGAVHNLSTGRPSGPPGRVQPPEAGPRRQPTAAEVIGAQDQAEAWMAVIGDYLDQAYPDARMFETLDAMLAVFPPAPQSVPRETQCYMCQEWFPDIHDHYMSCGKFRFGA
jgi:hypothetical protein